MIKLKQKFKDRLININILNIARKLNNIEVLKFILLINKKSLLKI